MGEALIPDEVRTFLLQHIDSIAQLEALLLLRADPTCTWNAGTMAKRLYVSAEETAAVLEHLAAHGFVTTPPDPPDSYHYHPVSNDVAHMVDQVADLYAKYLIPVTHLIHSKPRTRVQEFADAFKLRKGD